MTIVGRDLGEIRSLAVATDRRLAGVGSRVVLRRHRPGPPPRTAARLRAHLRTGVFRRFGFVVVDRQQLPAKVSRDCIFCDHADDCNEVALILDLDTDR